MNAPATKGWVDRNQDHLTAALAEVRRLLETAGRAAGPTLDAPDPPPAGEEFALESIRHGFGLSDFERLVLLLAAGPEIDGTFPALCVEQAGQPYPTFGLALATLPGAHWSALTPGAPLRRWRLVHLGPGSVVTAPLTIDERVLHALVGAGGLDRDLGGLLEPVQVPDGLPPSQADLATRLAGLWSAGQPPVPQLVAGASGPAADIAAAAAAGIGMSLSVLDARAITSEPGGVAGLARLLEREGVLGAVAVLVDARDADPDRTPLIRQLLDGLAAPVALAVRERMVLGRRGTIVIEVGKPTSAEQRRLWQEEVGAEEAATLASQFDLDASTIRSLASSAASGASGASGPSRTSPTTASAGPSLWDATRARTRPRLGALAQRVDTAPSWDDLILPSHQRAQLDHIALHVRHRLTVHETWGFGRGSRLGSGTAALFAGPSGTGKTMAAQVLAAELRLDLFRVDLASVLSKYIGETEKNLGTLFDAADEGAVVLLFDEADALFGKRSEVKDSHDRYANLEISYLLQRIETQRGLVLLTTNLQEALDPAFARRLRFIVEFPFPDRATRAAMWRRAFPPETPLGPIDAEGLAALNLSGAGIRNVALSAAVLAAEDGTPVGMAHLERAARTECAKLDQPFPLRPAPAWEPAALAEGGRR